MQTSKPIYGTIHLFGKDQVSGKIYQESLFGENWISIEKPVFDITSRETTCEFKKCTGTFHKPVRFNKAAIFDIEETDFYDVTTRIIEGYFTMNDSEGDLPF